ncbi:hypothetical protein F110043I8_02280 [Ruminococcus sp. f11]
MKLVIVRHGDPDYSIDSLTEKGWKEVEYLSEKLSKFDVKEFYVSPLGRAKDTASLTLKKMNRTAVECDWLREFDVLIDRPDVTDRKIILWDWLPQDWMKDERFYQYDHWFENERLQKADAKGYYDYVTGKFDELLASHGYVREGHYYRADANYAQTECQFRYCGTAIPFLTVRSTAR